LEAILTPEFLDLLTDDYSSEFIIEVWQVERRLSNINIYKAPGPDQLPSWILRDFAPLIAEPLAVIFNTRKLCYIAKMTARCALYK